MAFTDNAIQISVVKNGGPLDDNTYEADGSAVYKTGMLLTKNVDGQVIPALTAEADGLHAIYRGTSYSSAPAAGTKLAVQEITEDTRFMVQLTNGGGGAATPAQNMIGQRYDIEVSSAGNGYICSLDVNASAQDNMEVTAVPGNAFWYDSAGNKAAANGLVEAKVVPAEIDTAPA